ncbi:MAG: glycosyltransferase family 2 protein [Chloroflexi bacterium]|nr:glycosyltransferase family 2 protein [Chloroflexota bacterium]
MRQSPIVSVILPTHNRAALVQHSIRSVLAQTYTDYELIVVDDGSTDGTEAALAQDGRLRYVRQANAGPAAARNRGLRLARGELITFLDDDDLYEPEKLAEQVGFFETHPDAMLLHSCFSKFNDAGEDLGVRDTTWFQGWLYPEILAHWGMMMAAPTVMVRRGVLDEVGGFDESLRWAEDPDLWRRIARRYPFHVLPESLVRVRQQAVSVSSDKTRAAGHFRLMLEKAFADDPDLPPAFRRRAMAAMYTNVCHNLLGAGGPAEMRLARRHALTALGLRPSQWGAWAGLGASFIPRGLRAGLAAAFRRLRFRRG